MYLMHKDVKVAEIRMRDHRPMGVIRVIEPEHLPIGLGTDIDTADMNLQSWHSRRAIPYGRVGSEELFKMFGSPEELSVQSMGLSLTDCYWYFENPDIVKWDDISLHKNGFSPDLLLYSLDMLSTLDLSPDYTTDGFLEKFWTMDASGPMLIKSGDVDGVTNGTGVLAANEVAACRIADLMGIKHAEYKIVNINGKNPGEKRVMCASKCFIKDDRTEFITAESLKEHSGKMSLADSAVFEDFVKMGLEDSLNAMKTFDLLIGNHDRHLSNFGYLRDPDTFEVIGFAPLYDSGSSLGWNRIMDPEMKPYNRKRSELLNDADMSMVPSIEKIEKIVAEAYEEASIPSEQVQTAMASISSFYRGQGLDTPVVSGPEEECL